MYYYDPTADGMLAVFEWRLGISEQPWPSSDDDDDEFDEHEHQPATRNAGDVFEVACAIGAFLGALLLAAGVMIFAMPIVIEAMLAWGDVVEVWFKPEQELVPMPEPAWPASPWTGASPW